MADILTPIPAGQQVSPIRHPEEADKNVSSWFQTEYLELNFGDTVGRPDSSITLQREYLAQFLQTGWTVDAVLETGDSGHWVQTGGTITTSKSATLSQRDLWDSETMLFDRQLDLVAQNPAGSTPRRIALQNVSGNTERPVEATYSTSSPSNEAPAYWTAYQKIRLKRRRLIAEFVMQSMITSFTGAYNSGRGIEDTRYNEIVSLYTLMLSRSENEGNAIVSGATDLMPLATRMADSVMGSVDTADTASDELAAKSTENRRRDVNRQFDSLVSQKQAEMISAGLYNGSVWATVQAGIERQRSEALDKAEEAGNSVKFQAKSSLATTKSGVAAQLLTAMQGVASASDQRKITVVELRNSVLKWMLDYIGTREERYPELEEVATVSEKMGFSVGSAGSVL